MERRWYDKFDIMDIIDKVVTCRYKYTVGNTEVCDLCFVMGFGVLPLFMTGVIFLHHSYGEIFGILCCNLMGVDEVIQ